MASTKQNPSVEQVSNPGLKQANGNWFDESRSHIKGAASSTKPPRKRG